jgi:hypothetical protein
MRIGSSRSPIFEFLCLVLFSFGAISAPASTIHVPGDQPTIQAGINAASNGDTVLVAPGTYYENIDFVGKAITVTSSGGAAQTSIDGSSGQNPTVVFRNKEAKTSILSGFTIQGGGIETFPAPQTNYGNGGILIQQGSPVIANNVITHNHCNGIQSNNSSPLIENNEIDNTLDAQGQCGFAGGSAIWLDGSLSYYNAGNQPQGLPAIVTGNIIQNNTQSGRDDAGGNGGTGVAVWGAYASIIGNTIRNNVTLGDGGAILAFNTDDVTVIGNLIYGNKAATDGAISLEPPEATIGPFIGILASNTIYGNTQTSSHGGAYGDTPPAQVYLSGNLGQYLLVNNIIVGAGQGSVAVACGTIYNYLSLTPLVFDHNDIYNPGGPAYGGACPDQTGSYGNISVDPRFSNPTSGDYHLLQGSSAIDAGNNSAPQLLTKDLDGNPRLQDATGQGYPIVDMGAYEFASMQDANSTILTLTPSTYETYGGNSITLTAKLTSANGTPTGSVIFFEDGSQLGASVIDATGTATFMPQGLVPGVHAFLATYAGAGSFTPAVSVKFYVLIDKYIPTLHLSGAPNPSLLNQPVTFTITATSPDNVILSPITLTEGSTTLATLSPNSSGAATYTTSSLTLGTHFLQASYAGDATHAQVGASLTQTVVNGYPTPSTLTSSQNPASIGQPITFTDIITFNGSASASAPGTVTFYDNNGVILLGSQAVTAQPNSTATATFTTGALAIGTHNISAVLTSGNAYSSAATLNQVILGQPTTTMLIVSPLSGYALQPITLSATVSGTGATIPTGTVTFYDGATALGSSPLDNTGHAALTTSTLTGGTHLLHAMYNGDSMFASSTSPSISVTLQLIPTSTALAMTPSPSAALQATSATVQVAPITSPQYSSLLCLCTVTLTITGLPPNVSPTYTLPIHNGTATFNFGFGFSAGTYTFSAAFSGSTAFAASTSSTVQQTVVVAPTSLGLTASPTTATQHQAINFTATLAAPISNASPAGTLTFFDGSTPFATAPIAANTQGNTVAATISTSALTVGTHAISANYPGSLNFNPATSAPVTVTITPSDYTLTTPNPAISIKTEHHLAIGVNLASIGGFADNIALACTDLPAHASCTFDKNSLQLLPNGTATTNVTIDTDDVHGYARDESPGAANSMTYALLPVSLLTLYAARRRRRLLRLLLMLIAISGLSLVVDGCSGLYPKSTAPGTYTINLSGVGANTKLTHTQAITLTVTP